jgi:hypothetical protein
MAHLFLFVFVAILLCTAQLCLGLWIGAKFGRIQEQRRWAGNAEPSDPCQAAGNGGIPWTESLVLIESLAQQVQSLTLASIRCQPALPDQILLALSELQKVTTALQQQINAGLASQPNPSPGNLAQENRVSPVEPPHDPPRAFAKESPRNSREADIRRHADLSDAPETTPEASADGEQHIFSYDAVGYMAPCDEHEVPHSDAFRPVICHAISVHTISFYADSPPNFAFLTISVGPAPQVIFILCRVRFWREVYLEQQHRYLVSCEFARRLKPEEIRWQDVFGATTDSQEGQGSLSEQAATR